MANMHVFTSCNYYYLDRAKVLAKTVKQYHPDWTFWLLLADYPEEKYKHNWSNEPFDKIFWIHELDIPNIHGWIFKHDVVELCTAVKGPFLQYLLNQGADKVIYLDPDIALFSPITLIEDLLDSHSIILTPHQLDPEEEDYAIKDNELCSSLHGIFNLGFLAVKNDDQGNRFASWWRDRLTKYCYDEKDKGIFVDQKWCDLVPAYFDRFYSLRDYGCNVASWNLSNRKITIDHEGRIFANGDLLKFYHFTKLGPIGDTMTERYAKDNLEVYELWSWYKRQVSLCSDPGLPKKWFYGYFDNGEKIQNNARSLYKTRKDLQDSFIDPYSTQEGGFFQWLKENHFS